MGTNLHFRTSLQPAHIRAPPAIGHDREQRHVLTPCTRNNLRPTFVGTLPALSYAAEPRRSSRRRPYPRNGRRTKARHGRGLSVFTYSPTYPLTDRRGSAWRLFVPIPSSRSSHEHCRGSNSDQ